MVPGGQPPPDPDPRRYGGAPVGAGERDPWDTQLRVRNLDGGWKALEGSYLDSIRSTPNTYYHIIWPTRCGLSLLDPGPGATYDLWPVMLMLGDVGGGYNTPGQLPGIALVTGQDLTRRDPDPAGRRRLDRHPQRVPQRPRRLLRREVGLMAASYQTGISSSPTSLLQALVTWLTGQGWTVNQSEQDGAGWRAHLVKAGSLHVNLRAAENERIWTKGSSSYHDLGNGGYGIGLYLGTGWDGEAPWDAQPGGPMRPYDLTTSGCGMNLPQGSVAAYHFFDDGNDHITVVVERAPGIFCHMGWGPSLERASLPEPFPYFFASSSTKLNTAETADILTGNRRGIDLTAYPPMSHTDEDYSTISGSSTALTHCTAFVRVDAASFSGRWIGDCKARGRGLRLDRPPHARRPEQVPRRPGRHGRGRVRQLPVPVGRRVGRSGERTLQSAFGGALLLPLHCFMETEPQNRWAPIGYPPTVFWTEAVGNGYSAGDIYQLGGQNYMLFPFFAVRKAA